MTDRAQDDLPTLVEAVAAFTALGQRLRDGATADSPAEQRRLIRQITATRRRARQIDLLGMQATKLLRGVARAPHATPEASERHAV